MARRLPIRGRRKTGRKRKAIPRTESIPGRPRTSRKPSTSKLTDKLIDEISKLIWKDGLPIDICCDYLGITKTTYYLWKDKGEKYLLELDTPEGPEVSEDKAEAVFVQAILKARARWQLNIRRRSFTKDYKSTWVRDMTQLERRDRKNWGRNETIRHEEAAEVPDNSYL